IEITNERVKCLKKYFSDEEERRKVNIEFASFSDGRGVFDDYDSLNDRGIVDAKSWWLIHGGKAKFLQPIALMLLEQPSSSSCCERNWSTYSFYLSTLIFTFFQEKLETIMWDIAGDVFHQLMKKMVFLKLLTFLLMNQSWKE
ncbi:hypothetical protein HN51_062836, partial [Arachis hypogaea]